MLEATPYVLAMHFMLGAVRMNNSLSTTLYIATTSLTEHSLLEGCTVLTFCCQPLSLTKASLISPTTLNANLSKPSPALSHMYL